MVYEWKAGAVMPVPAQVAGEVCEELDGRGMLTPHNLVEESRPEGAPLHQAFEWRDDVAAERYREVQARQVIRYIVSVPEGSPTGEPTRSFVSVVSEGGERGYRSIDAVLRDASSRESMLEDARRDLMAFQRKYSQLKELGDVFRAIGAFAGSLMGEDAA